MWEVMSWPLRLGIQTVCSHSKASNSNITTSHTHTHWISKREVHQWRERRWRCWTDEGGSGSGWFGWGPRVGFMSVTSQNTSEYQIPEVKSFTEQHSAALLVGLEFKVLFVLLCFFIFFFCLLFFFFLFFSPPLPNQLLAHKRPAVTGNRLKTTKNRTVWRSHLLFYIYILFKFNKIKLRKNLKS